MADVVLIGGGVIGLSIAFELSERGAAVTLLEKSATGREASWAGAGMIPVSTAGHDASQLQPMVAASAGLHPSFAERLKELTGLDNGYRRCGAIYVARSEQAEAGLASLASQLMRDGVDARPLDAEGVHQLEPNTRTNRRGDRRVRAGLLVPAEAQIRNPWHVAALTAACRTNGVRIVEQSTVQGLEVDRNRVSAVVSTTGRYVAGRICLTSGAWTSPLAATLGLDLHIRPVRGQMVLLRGDRPVLTRNVNEGPKYIVPRDDGRVLIGSTMEEVGFDKSTTSREIETLLAMAVEIAPPLAELPVEQQWAGLRPATRDGLPYLGPIPGFENAWIAAGHFRLGLTLAPVTGQIMAEMISDIEPSIDVTAFGVDRSAEV